MWKGVENYMENLSIFPLPLPSTSVVPLGEIGGGGAGNGMPG